MTFAQWVTPRFAALFRFAVVLVGDRGVAQDVLQEVLIRVDRNWARIAEMSQPQAYVHRMIINEYLSWRRKWARIIPTAPNRFPELIEVDAIDHDADHDRLIAELAALPRQQRAAVVLRFYEGLTDEEAADRMGCRAVTVRGYISRALKTLRVELSAEVSDPRPLSPSTEPEVR